MEATRSLSVIDEIKTIWGIRWRDKIPFFFFLGGIFLSFFPSLTSLPFFSCASFLNIFSLYSSRNLKEKKSKTQIFFQLLFLFCKFLYRRNLAKLVVFFLFFCDQAWSQKKKEKKWEWFNSHMANDKNLC